MGATINNCLSIEHHDILLRALISDRIDVLMTSREYLEDVVKTGLKGFNVYSDAELIKAAVDADLGVTLADIGLDETGNPIDVEVFSLDSTQQNPEKDLAGLTNYSV